MRTRVTDFNESPVHRSLRRLTALLFLALPVSLIGRASANFAASSRAAPLPPRQPHAFVVDAPVVTRVAQERAESAVVLVVLDGVRWQEVFYGADRALASQRGLNPLAYASPRALMPQLRRFIDTRAVAIGAPAHGAEVDVSGPQLISLPGYLEIFSGKPDAACDANDCVTHARAATIADEVRDAGGPEDVAVVTSWPNIARAASIDASRFVASAGRSIVENEALLRADAESSELLDRSARSQPFPGQGDYRPDAITSRLALRVLITQRPRLLFVGLGDSDEQAHRDDYSGYLEAIHASDAFLGDLIATLDTMGARGRHTTVIVTADHGRAWTFKDHGPTFPEAARVWLVAGGGDVKHSGLVAAARKHTLSDVAPTVRALLGMQGEGEPLREVVGDL